MFGNQIMTSRSDHMSVQKVRVTLCFRQAQRPASTNLMGAVGGLTMHEGRRTQTVLERLAQQRVAPVAYITETRCSDQNKENSTTTFINIPNKSCATG